MTETRPLVLATAGHVDHGKSTLVEALTGTHPDRLAEEQRRGMTIDLGFAFATLPSGRPVALVDVPGHVRFLRTMLSGVGSVDAALLVVDAGEGWMPQTEEHLRILELLGVGASVVAVTKASRVGADDRADVVADVRRRLAGTALAAAPLVVTDALDGTGLGELRAALDDLPDDGRHSRDVGRPRLWVDRAFAIRGAGTVVTGTLTGGGLAVGDEVVLHDLGRAVRVRGLQSAGEDLPSVGPGRRVALNLVGVDAAEVHRGEAVVRSDQWHPSATLDALLEVLASLDHPVARRGAHLLYVGSAEVAVRVRVLGPTTVPPGGRGLVRLHLPRRLALAPGDRFVLRDAGRDETVGGGEVLEVDPLLPASRAHPDRDVARVVAERGWIDVDELARRTGARRAPDVGRWAVDPAALTAARDAVLDRLRAAGPTGVETAELDERARALLEGLDGVTVRGTRAVLGDDDPLEHEPWLAALRRSPFDPPAAEGRATAATVRDLVASGRVVELAPGLHVAAEAVDAAARILGAVGASRPEGLTVGEVRDALRSNRRVVVPLLERLEAAGRTRRVGDRHLPA